MTVLIVAEHNGEQLNAATLHAVAAAQQLGDIHILVAGSGCLKISRSLGRTAARLH